jgi:hypothetical protein
MTHRKRSRSNEGHGDARSESGQANSPHWQAAQEQDHIRAPVNPEAITTQFPDPAMRERKVRHRKSDRFAGLQTKETNKASRSEGKRRRE